MRDMEISCSINKKIGGYITSKRKTWLDNYHGLAFGCSIMIMVQKSLWME